MTNHSYHNQVVKQEWVSQLLEQLQSQAAPITPLQLLQTSMNLFMQAERQLHLAQQPQDKGNGSYTRKLGTPMGELHLTVPRDRDGDFRPSLLPEKYQRDVAEREELLESLLINGYSPQQIQHTLKRLQLHYNPQEIEALREHYHQLFCQWQQRELPADVIGLFVDAYHAESLVEDKVRKVVVYVIIGIDFTGHKSLYGLYLYVGSETKGFWLQTLNQLIARGLTAPLFVVSDDFPGLKEAIATLFPQALHQLCVIHLQRNVYKNMAKADAKAFNQALNALKLLPNAEQAQAQCKALCQQYQSTYPSFMQALSSKTECYFAFLRLPEDVRKYFYTTNVVESFNATLERCRQRMGGFFQSETCLRVNVFLSLRKLQQTQWKKGVPQVIAHLYELRQLFAQRYDRLPDAKTLTLAA